jgi:hypothetical protein
MDRLPFSYQNLLNISNSQMLMQECGQPYDALVLLVTMSLNRIEAHIMTKQFTLAIEEMDYFLSVRITGYNVATDKIGSKILAKYPVIDNEYTPFYTHCYTNLLHQSNCGDEKKRVYSRRFKMVRYQTFCFKSNS